MKTSILVINAISLVVIDQVPCSGVPPFGVMALGSQWLAIPACQEHPEEDLALSFSTLDVAKDVGSQITSGIYYLGDITSKAVYNYYYGEAPPSEPAPKTTEPVSASSVAIFQMRDQKFYLLTSFRAHTQSISVLKFDPSGSLLVTAPIDGGHLNVYSISPCVNGKTQVHHLYKLNRGITSAFICDVSLSCDSSWLSVCTTRGTTHVFAINPQGGPVDIRTHSPVNEPRTPPPIETIDAQYESWKPPKLEFLDAVNRVKSELVDPAAETSTNQESNTRKIISCSYLPGRCKKMLVVTAQGVMVQHQIAPERVAPREVQMRVSINPELEWDINRRHPWPEIPSNLPAASSVSNEKHNWTSYIEVCTHSPNFQPVVGLRSLFHFKTISEQNPLGNTILLDHQLPIYHSTRASTSQDSARDSSQTPMNLQQLLQIDITQSPSQASSQQNHQHVDFHERHQDAPVHPEHPFTAFMNNPQPALPQQPKRMEEFPHSPFIPPAQQPQPMNFPDPQGPFADNRGASISRAGQIPNNNTGVPLTRALPVQDPGMFPPRGFAAPENLPGAPNFPAFGQPQGAPNFPPRGFAAENLPGAPNFAGFRRALPPQLEDEKLEDDY
jgi:hypothetical protein